MKGKNKFKGMELKKLIAIFIGIIMLLSVIPFFLMNL